MGLAGCGVGLARWGEVWLGGYGGSGWGGGVGLARWGGGLAGWVGGLVGWGVWLGSWGGGLAGWVGELIFQSVDRCIHECYWFLRRQWHLDGRQRDHQ